MIWSKRLFMAALAVGAMGVLLGISPPSIQGQRPPVLQIGATSTLTPDGWTDARQKAALQSLENFIKDQTSLENKITHDRSWRLLVDNMTKRRYQMGVFAGYEFAWAQAKCPSLKPLALAVNGPRYSVISLVSHASNPATSFSGVQNQTLGLPPCGQNLARRYMELEARAAGKNLDAYFSKVVSPDNTEDALDGIVDGTIQVAAVDRIGLEAYKRRKPGRSRHLKEITQSQQFPPVVVAYYDQALDTRTLSRFQEGLLGANRRAKGETLLTLFRLTKFDGIPPDFGRVLIETRKAFPPDDGTD